MGVKYPESKSKNNFLSFAAESQVQGRAKLNVIFTPEKLLKRGQIALFRIVWLEEGPNLKPTLLLNHGLLNYLDGVNK